MVSKGMVRCLVVYGLVWLAGGIMLLFKGVHLVMDPITQPTGKSNPFLFLTDLSGWIGGLQEAALILILLALVVGHLKARFVFPEHLLRLLPLCDVHQRADHSNRFARLIPKNPSAVPYPSVRSVWTIDPMFDIEPVGFLNRLRNGFSHEGYYLRDVPDRRSRPVSRRRNRQMCGRSGA